MLNNCSASMSAAVYGSSVQFTEGSPLLWGCFVVVVFPFLCSRAKYEQRQQQTCLGSILKLQVAVSSS